MSDEDNVTAGSTPPRRTPLAEAHEKAGARMVDFAGWFMPVQYESILAEHAAVREAAGLFDVSHMGEVEISGPGAEACCARLFTNDARTLAPGRAQYSLIANERGGLVDDVIVYRLAAERFMVCLNASNTAKDLAWIHERADNGAGGFVIEDRSDETALIAIQGPAAAQVLARAGLDLGDLARFSVVEAELQGVTALFARTGYTGEDGFEMFLPASAASATWDLLLERGADSGLRPAGLGARDTLRVEAALPLYGHELGEDISPYEARIGWAVKLGREDMVGHAALKAAKEGGVARRLIGLAPAGGIAREGAAVLAADGSVVGKVTSGTHSPTLGKPVALAMVDSSASLDGLSVEIRKKRREASVTDLPFYVRQAAS